MRLGSLASSPTNSSAGGQDRQPWLVNNSSSTFDVAAPAHDGDNDGDNTEAATDAVPAARAWRLEMVCPSVMGRDMIFPANTCQSRAGETTHNTGR